MLMGINSNEEMVSVQHVYTSPLRVYLVILPPAEVNGVMVQYVSSQSGRCDSGLEIRRSELESLILYQLIITPNWNVQDPVFQRLAVWISPI